MEQVLSSLAWNPFPSLSSELKVGLLIQWKCRNTVHANFDYAMHSLNINFKLICLNFYESQIRTFICLHVYLATWIMPTCLYMTFLFLIFSENNTEFSAVTLLTQYYIAFDDHWQRKERFLHLWENKVLGKSYLDPNDSDMNLTWDIWIASQMSFWKKYSDI